MIHVAGGDRINSLISRALMAPETLKHFFACSPFIDDEMVPMLDELTCACRPVYTAVTVITSPSAAAKLERLSRAGRARMSVVATPRLHAKLYLAVGRAPYRSDGLISSGNLTRAGTGSNVELGVYFDEQCAVGRRLLSQAHSFVRRIIRDTVVRPRLAG